MPLLRKSVVIESWLWWVISPVRPLCLLLVALKRVCIHLVCSLSLLFSVKNIWEGNSHFGDIGTRCRNRSSQTTETTGPALVGRIRLDKRRDGQNNTWWNWSSLWEWLGNGKLEWQKIANPSSVCHFLLFLQVLRFTEICYFFIKKLWLFWLSNSVPFFCNSEF